MDAVFLASVGFSCFGCIVLSKAQIKRLKQRKLNSDNFPYLVVLLVCLLWGFADFSAKLNSLDFQQIRAMIIPVSAASALCSCLLFIRCQSLYCTKIQNQVTLHSLQTPWGGRCIYLLARCVNNSNTLSPPFFIRFIFHILFR